MTRRALRAAAAVLAVALAVVPVASDERLTLVFAPPGEGAALLGASDTFTRAMTLLDRQIRARSPRIVTEAEVLAFLSAQATAWRAAETRRLQPIADDVAARVRAVAPMLTGRVPLVRTTALVESGLPHTRGTAIVLPERVLAWNDAALRRLLAHELFHILTRGRPALRDRLYAAIGFRPCVTVDVPETMAATKITNPDAPDERFAISIRFQGVPFEVIPMVFSSAASAAAAVTTPIAAQAALRFVAVERAGDRCVLAVGPDVAVMFPETDVEGLFDQVGRNTRYVMHPEEILADNFALLVLGERNVPSPEIVERVRTILTAP